MPNGPESVTELLREIWFWSAVFHDHAAFIHDNLAPDQAQPIGWSDQFRKAFTHVHAEARRLAEAAGIPGPAGSYALTGRPTDLPLAGLQGQGLLQLEQEAERLSRGLVEGITALRAFKEQLIQQKLACSVKLGLGPSLLNHMVIEAGEAMRVLSRRQEGDLGPPSPAQEALHQHLIWLPDAAGHAAVLHGDLDGTEAELLKETCDFKRIFDGMHLKAQELDAMLRVAPRMVGALRRLTDNAMAQIAVFRAFLAELREHLENCEVLGRLVPLLADHMLREELYYTEKIEGIEGFPPMAE